MAYDWRAERYRRLMAERANAAANLDGYHRQGAPDRPMTWLIREAIEQERMKLARLDAELDVLDLLTAATATTPLDGTAAVRQLNRRVGA
jgi:hypothetical protein